MEWILFMLLAFCFLGTGPSLIDTQETQELVPSGMVPDIETHETSRRESERDTKGSRMRSVTRANGAAFSIGGGAD